MSVYFIIFLLLVRVIRFGELLFIHLNYFLSVLTSVIWFRHIPQQIRNERRKTRTTTTTTNVNRTRSFLIFLYIHIYGSQTNHTLLMRKHMLILCLFFHFCWCFSSIFWAHDFGVRARFTCFLFLLNICERKDVICYTYNKCTANEFNLNIINNFNAWLTNLTDFARWMESLEFWAYKVFVCHHHTRRSDAIWGNE